MSDARPRALYTCAYTPLPLIHAAGFVPHRLLPTEAADHVPDQAGAHLHDNLCPHVKRVLDRALGGDLPDGVAGVVLMSSCDAMRRLADAWAARRSDDSLVLIDLPTTTGPTATRFLAGEMQRLALELGRWEGGVEPTDGRLRHSVSIYRRLAEQMERRRELATRGALSGGWQALQLLLNRAVTEEPEALLTELKSAPHVAEQEVGGDIGRSASPRGVPVYLFGNVMSDPEALAVLEECGASIVGDDLCTGSRQLAAVPTNVPKDNLLAWLARWTLERPPCARTLIKEPEDLADRLVRQTRASGARGVVAHVLKFCDPYLARLPSLKTALREAGMPLLVLEGDCTLRSIGQHRTRIEAFVEMLA